MQIIYNIDIEQEEEEEVKISAAKRIRRENLPSRVWKKFEKAQISGGGGGLRFWWRPCSSRKLQTGTRRVLLE